VGLLRWGSVRESTVPNLRSSLDCRLLAAHL
jgi:hypothetical protein